MKTQHNRISRTLNAFKRTDCYRALIWMSSSVTILGIFMLISYINHLIFRSIGTLPDSCDEYKRCMDIYLIITTLEIIILAVVCVTIYLIFYWIRNAYHVMYLEYTTIDDTANINP